MPIAELGGRARRLAIDQPRRPVRVELDHPVAHDLQRHPADPSRLGPGRTFVDRCQSQQTTRLRAVLAVAGHPANGIGVEVTPERNRHGEPPWLATLNQI